MCIIRKFCLCICLVFVLADTLYVIISSKTKQLNLWCILFIFDNIFIYKIVEFYYNPKKGPLQSFGESFIFYWNDSSAKWSCYLMLSLYLLLIFVQCILNNKVKLVSKAHAWKWNCIIKYLIHASITAETFTHSVSFLLLLFMFYDRIV